MPCAVRPADLRVRLSVTGERVDRLDDMMPCRAVRTAGPDEICIRAPSGGVELFMHRPGDGVYSRHSVVNIQYAPNTRANIGGRH